MGEIEYCLRQAIFWLSHDEVPNWKEFALKNLSRIIELLKHDHQD